MKSFISKNRRLVGMMLGLPCALIAVLALVSQLGGGAGASGVPVKDPLFYSGLLTDTNGKPLAKDVDLTITLWDAKTAGKKLCSTSAAKTKLSLGRFRVALHADCATAVRKIADTWVEVTVDGKSLGLTKIGAVPYAVEAGSVAEQRCPPGYAFDTKTTGITLCKRGKDEMVKVGDFWVDRYETSIVDSSAYNSGTCDGAGKQFGKAGQNSYDDYPNTTGKEFPDNGNVTLKLYACSSSGTQPSAHMTWFQAAAACALAGKHLCTNGEWQLAALGTPDDSFSCVLGKTYSEVTGNRKKCESLFGARDMVGNLTEWVDWWGAAGPTWINKIVEHTTAWPLSTSSTGKHFGLDKTYNVNGTAHNRVQPTKGMPAAAVRGGNSSMTTEAGVFLFDLRQGPSNFLNTVGARCCRR